MLKLIIVKNFHKGSYYFLLTSAESPSPAFDAFGKAEISNLKIPSLVDQQILRFQITVNQVEVMQVFKR